MPFDGSHIDPALAFMAAHNLTRSPALARMSMRELRAFYESCAYAPTVNGVQYAVALEEPDMFAFNDVPELTGFHPDDTDHGEQDQLIDDLPTSTNPYRVGLYHQHKDFLA